ncbi:MAG: hypothetical protein LBM78_01240, partial [Clostridiales bacterium]|nr:hypothetical protein [Clostridiales bacterium]
IAHADGVFYEDGAPIPRTTCDGLLDLAAFDVGMLHYRRALTLPAFRPQVTAEVPTPGTPFPALVPPRPLLPRSRAEAEAALLRLRPDFVRGAYVGDPFGIALARALEGHPAFADAPTHDGFVDCGNLTLAYNGAGFSAPAPFAHTPYSALCGVYRLLFSAAPPALPPEEEEALLVTDFLLNAVHRGDDPEKARLRAQIAFPAAPPSQIAAKVAVLFR